MTEDNVAAPEQVEQQQSSPPPKGIVFADAGEAGPSTEPCGTPTTADQNGERDTTPGKYKTYNRRLSSSCHSCTVLCSVCLFPGVHSLKIIIHLQASLLCVSLSLKVSQPYICSSYVKIVLVFWNFQATNFFCLFLKNFTARTAREKPKSNLREICSFFVSYQMSWEHVKKRSAKIFASYRRYLLFLLSPKIPKILKTTLEHRPRVTYDDQGKRRFSTYTEFTHRVPEQSPKKVTLTFFCGFYPISQKLSIGIGTNRQQLFAYYYVMRLEV